MEVTQEMVRQAFRRDQAATAVFLAPRWLQAHPDDFGTILDYAEMLYQMARYEDAIRVYSEALGDSTADESDRWAICNQLGRMYDYWDHPAESEPWFRKAIENEPDEAISYIFLGDCQARQGKSKEAEATYRAAIQLGESWPQDDAYHNLGLVLRAEGRLAEAAECFRKAIDMDGEFAEAITALEDVTMASALSTDAEAVWNRTERQGRALIEVAYRRGHAATTALLASRWLQSHPNDLGIALHYAEMLSRLTRYEDAIRAYEGALGKVKEGERSRWAIFTALGSVYRRWGHPAEAETWFRKAIDSEPGEVACYVYLGACQARQGKLTEAEQTHRAATQVGESSLLDEAYHNLGLVLRGQGRLAEATECFRKAIEIDPRYADAIEALEDVQTALALTGGTGVIH